MTKRIQPGRRQLKERLALALEVTTEIREQANAAAAARATGTQTAADRDAARARLAELAPMLERHDESRRFLADHIADLTASVEGGRRSLDGRLELARQSEPRIWAAASARLLATSIEEHLRSASARMHDAFAAAVTKSFRSLAHKGQIGRIRIDASGAVQLADAAGNDVTDYRMSAGENQLFAMALIAAVGELVGNQLPLFVDTPLGRLDTRHRSSVLEMMTRRRGQTVLLTQPEEMTVQHVEAVRSALAGVVELRHSVDDRTGVGVSGFQLEPA